MLVCVVENVPPKVRGRLALWLLEVRAGVYLGKLNAKRRESLWAEIVPHLGEGNAVMVWPESSEQGYAFRTAGENRRTPADFDGLTLVSFEPMPEKPDETTGEDQEGIPL
jgi:CRISPR-associated protein Cas2